MSRIFLRRRFIDYALRGADIVEKLPLWLLVKSFCDYLVIRARNVVKPIPDDNFEAWIINRFGRTLYELFFGVYTRKTWGIPGTQISADWAAQRISLLSLWDTVKKTLFRPKDSPRTYVSRFLYPKTGGIGALARGYRRLIEQEGGRLVLSARVRRIGTDGAGTVTGVVYERDGVEHEQRSDLYISTIPITDALPMMGEAVPPEVIEAAGALVHKGIVFVYLKLAREQVTPDHWVYIPEPHIAVHRISEFKNFSSACAPEGRTLVCAEITASRDDHHWSMDDEALVELATRNLATLGLIEPGEVEGGFVRRVDYAYPIYDLTYRENLRTLTEFVKTMTNFLSTGRQGLFRYGNMDHSVAMGHAVARRVLQADEIDHAAVASGDEYFG